MEPRFESSDGAEDGRTDSATSIDRTDPPDWLSSVIHQSTEALVAFGPDGVVVYSNEAADRLVRLAPDSLIGHNALEMVHPDDLGRAASNIVAVEDGARPRPGLLRICLADGTESALDITPMHVVLPPPPQGPGDLTVVILRDTMLHDAHWNFLTNLSAGQPFDQCVESLASGLSSSTDGPLAVAYNDLDTGERRAIGPLPCSLAGVTTAGTLDPTPGTPWATAIATGEPTVIAVEALPPNLTHEAHSIGAAACVVVPVPDPSGGDPALIIQWPPTAAMGEVVLEALARRPRLAVLLAFERRDAQRRLEHLALHDSLTGLPNRVRFFDAIAALLSARLPFAVCYLDLDHFKPVNDALGHRAGDLALVTVAARLQQVARPGDLLARLGGDEFGLLCPGLHDLGPLEALCANLVDALDEPIRLFEHTMRVGVSVGAAIATNGSEGEAVVGAADAALYDAKRAGRGTWKVAPSTISP